jgi:hypothetical protein
MSCCLPVEELLVDELSVNGLSVNQLLVDQFSVEEDPNLYVITTPTKLTAKTYTFVHWEPKYPGSRIFVKWCNLFEKWCSLLCIFLLVRVACIELSYSKILEWRSYKCSTQTQ